MASATQAERKHRKWKIAIATITTLTIERQKLKDALRDLLWAFDRRDDSGWTAADVKRLEEIRELVKR